MDRWNIDNSEEQQSDTYLDPENEIMDKEESLTIVNRNIKGTNRLVKFNQSMRDKGYTEVNREFDEKTEFAINCLSKQEKKVFKLISSGKSMDEVASKLKITRQTVQTYWKRIKEKLP